MRIFKSFKILILGSALITMIGCQKNRLPSNIAGNVNNGSTITPGHVEVIQATASDAVGVTKVEFYVNGVLTCTVVKPPYSCPWTVPSASGVAYQLQTKAYNAMNKIGLSPIVNVTSL